MSGSFCINVAARRHSQDCCATFLAGDARVVVVADGAGGLAGGQSAAQHVVAELHRAVNAHPASALDQLWWVHTLLAFDRELFRARDLGETTAVVVAMDNSVLVGASVGDSEAWLLGQDNFELTRGQTRKRLGSGKAEPVPFILAGEHGRLIVGSDGLFSRVALPRIIEIGRIGPPHRAGAELLNCARLRTGDLVDDFSAVIVDVD